MTARRRPYLLARSGPLARRLAPVAALAGLIALTVPGPLGLAAALVAIVTGGVVAVAGALDVRRWLRSLRR
ncbi:hypothetical protein [Phytohabitans houttuyneae]|uniref:Uncharacterized protein n=1 Tax=Phytohabitans houttuyneae TaxID=1076126 RepID=A0A6V8KD68_9ACTN|nr:hypothetical protein [Phytohabitans houttuyneae]GFJ80089.1 hypothetical protein Phou_042690 [Phytohabitans houttuyneae]